MLEENGKFSWGINIDNVWTYAGLPPPKSAIIPFLISVRLPRGPEEILSPHPNIKKAFEEHMGLLDKSDKTSPSLVKSICQDLLAKLKETGVSFVRAWFPWNFFNTNADQDSSEFLMDTFVETLNAGGIGILGVIGNGYSRFLPSGASVDHLEKYLSQLVPASREIVRHYKDSIRVWQIENEPNWWKEHMAAHWRAGVIWLESNSDQIILKSLHDIVREECPYGRVLINVEGDRHSNIKWERYARYCDIIGLDFYPGYTHPHLTSADEIATVASEVKKATGKQVIIAETGQPSGPHLLGYGEDGQARYVSSACETAYSCDALSALCTWRFSDSYWRSFPMQENYFGLLTKEGNPKASWFEYTNQVKSKA